MSKNQSTRENNLNYYIFVLHRHFNIWFSCQKHYLCNHVNGRFCWDSRFYCADCQTIRTSFGISLSWFPKQGHTLPFMITYANAGWLSDIQRSTNSVQVWNNSNYTWFSKHLIRYLIKNSWAWYKKSIYLVCRWIFKFFALEILHYMPGFST